MNLKEIPTKELADEIATRLDTCLILGMCFDRNNVLTFHRKFTGPNSWAMYGPLLAEIRWLNESFDEAIDDSGPDNLVEF